MDASPANATYASHNTCTKLLAAFAEHIRNDVLMKARASPAIGLMADESTDMRTRNEMSICLRFLVDGSPVEQFLCLQQLQSTTADSMSTDILELLKKCHIPLEKVYWLGFDGATNMAGKTNGVEAKLRSQMPNARYIHCRSHLLNLAACNVASKFKLLKEIFSMFNSIWKFFHGSPKRHTSLVEMQRIVEDPQLISWNSFELETRGGRPVSGQLKLSEVPCGHSSSHCKKFMHQRVTFHQKQVVFC